MAWITPIINWEDNDALSYEPFQRIEVNTEYLRILLG